MSTSDATRHKSSQAPAGSPSPVALTVGSSRDSARYVGVSARVGQALYGLNKQAVSAALITGFGATLFLLPTPLPATGVALQGGAMLLVFIGLWLVRATPDYLAAIVFFGAVPALGLAPTEIVFSGFRAGALWLILAGFVIGGTIEATGLGERLARPVAIAWGRSYAALVTCSVLVGLAFVFVAPSAIARVFVLVPIVIALCDRLGLERGSNGRSGLVLGAAFGTLLPCYAVLPSTAPNLVMLGTAERLFDIRFGYGEYLLVNFPVLAIFVVVALPVLICRLLPATVPDVAPTEKASPFSSREKILSCVLGATLVAWVTDFAHGVSPAWIALGAAALCLAPGFGPGRDVPIAKSVNLGLWLFIAAIIGAGSVVSYTGFADLSGRWLVDVAGLAPGDTVRNYATIVLIGMVVTVFATMIGAPSIVTPLAEPLAAAAELPISTVILLQVPTWMFFVLPHQLPAILPVMVLGGVRIGQCLRVLGALFLAGLLVALPLHFLWLRALGYL